MKSLNWPHVEWIWSYFISDNRYHSFLVRQSKFPLYKLLVLITAKSLFTYIHVTHFTLFLYALRKIKLVFCQWKVITFILFKFIILIFLNFFKSFTRDVEQKMHLVVCNHKLHTASRQIIQLVGKEGACLHVPLRITHCGSTNILPEGNREQWKEHRDPDDAWLQSCRV